MPLFLLIYFFIYGSLNWVFYLRLRVLLPSAPALRTGLMLGLALMVLLPIITHLLDSRQLHFWAGLCAWVGFTWMGFVFLAFWVSLLGFCCQALRPLLGLGNETRQVLACLSAYLALGLPLLLMLIGHMQSREMHLEEVRIQTDKLGRETSEISIAFISDVHLGLLAGQERVEDMIRLFETTQPDLILCAGDLVDGKITGLAKAAAALRRISPPLGKYAITGNHEVYSGLETSQRFLEDCGFQVLDEQTVRIVPGLRLAGRAYTREVLCSRDLPLLALEPAFTILLRHAPDICPDSLGRFDLQLSGHTHQGQIFPFGLIIKAVYPYISGLHDLGRGSRIYVSRGTGTWGPQVRLLAPPEMTLIRLRSLPEGAHAGLWSSG